MGDNLEVLLIKEQLKYRKMKGPFRRCLKRVLVVSGVSLLVLLSAGGLVYAVSETINVSYTPNGDPGPPPTVETSYTNGNAIVELFGNISSLGGSVVDSRGFVWGLESHEVPGNTAPEDTDYENFWEEEGKFGSEQFSHLPQDLSVNTDYFGRAFTEVNGEFIYSENEVTFDPILKTSPLYSMAAVLPYVFVGVCLVGAAAFAVAGLGIVSIVMIAVSILVAISGVGIIQDALASLL